MQCNTVQYSTVQYSISRVCVIIVNVVNCSRDLQCHGRSQAIHMTDIPLGTKRQFVSIATPANLLYLYFHCNKSHDTQSTWDIVLFKVLSMHDTQTIPSYFGLYLRYLSSIAFEMVHMTRFEYEVRIYCQSQTNLKVVKWG